VENSEPPSVTDIISILKKRHDRVCQISIDNVPNSFLEQVGEIIAPFPALIELRLTAFDDFGDPPTLPDSFLGGSAPRLRSLDLWGIPFPVTGKLLLTTRDLVILSLEFIRLPPSGFASPEEMVIILSTLTRLKTLQLRFKTPRFWTYGARGRPPVLTRVILPALTNFDYHGDSEYLEGVVSRIDAPLDSIVMAFSHELVVSDIPLLRDFICRTKIPDAPHRVDTCLTYIDARIALFKRKGDVDFKVLNLKMPCSRDVSNSRVWLLVQACGTFLPLLPNLEHLSVQNFECIPLQWQDEVYNTRWMVFLCLFITVKDLTLDELAVLSVSPALEELVGERVTEILPVLQNIVLEGNPPSGLVPEGIAKFVAARELSGHPAIVHHRQKMR
jgi:hypothetical protein